MAARVTTPGTTFVTVVFEPELPLLGLQAKSMARFLDPQYAARIIVLDNTAKGIPDRPWNRLLRSYGHLSGRVELIGAAGIGGDVQTTGWYSQQVIKLAVSAVVDSPYYVTLDSKNHFVRDAGRDDFEASDGRARGNFHGYETHPLRPKLDNVLAYFGLDTDAHVARFAATATPFTLYTAQVRSLITDIESTSGSSFAAEFVRAGVTEYFLYAAWLLSRGESPEAIYDPSGVDCPTIWPRGANIAGVSAAVEEVRTRNPALFSVHRTALARMDATSVRLLADFWTGRGLFDSSSSARAFVRSYRARYFPTMAVTKLRERRTVRSASVG